MGNVRQITSEVESKWRRLAESARVNEIERHTTATFTQGRLKFSLDKSFSFNGASARPFSKISERMVGWGWSPPALNWLSATLVPPTHALAVCRRQLRRLPPFYSLKGVNNFRHPVLLHPLHVNNQWQSVSLDLLTGLNLIESLCYNKGIE